MFSELTIKNKKVRLNGGGESRTLVLDKPRINAYMLSVSLLLSHAERHPTFDQATFISFKIYSKE